VRVKVRHRLSAVRARVEDHPDAAFGDAEAPRDLAGGEQRAPARSRSSGPSAKTFSTGRFGITSACTGACGLMSRNAMHHSSS
jgi:hypothetical protein